MTDRGFGVQRRNRSKETKKGEYQSGQMGQTVNLLVYTFGGSNPSSPTISGEDRRGNRPKETKDFEVNFL